MLVNRLREARSGYSTWAMPCRGSWSGIDWTALALALAWDACFPTHHNSIRFDGHPDSNHRLLIDYHDTYRLLLTSCLVGNIIILAANTSPHSVTSHTLMPTINSK
jgi:hypothetical protein